MCEHKRCEISSLLHDCFLILRAETNNQAIYYWTGCSNLTQAPQFGGGGGGGKRIWSVSDSRRGRETFDTATFHRMAAAHKEKEWQTPASLINMPGSAHRETLVVTHFELILSAWYISKVHSPAQMTVHTFPGRTRRSSTIETPA